MTTDSTQPWLQIQTTISKINPSNFTVDGTRLGKNLALNILTILFGYLPECPRTCLQVITTNFIAEDDGKKKIHFQRFSDYLFVQYMS